MSVCFCRNLWRMGNTDYLGIPAHQFQFFRYLHYNIAADTGIDFVKNQCADMFILCQYRFEGQHNTRHFTTGCDFAQSPQRLPRIGTHIKFHFIHTLRACMFVTKMNGKSCMLHRELCKLLQKFIFQLFCHCLAHSSYLQSNLFIDCPLCLVLPVQLFDFCIGIFQLIYF